MGRQRTLEPKAKEMIYQKIHEAGEMSRDEIVELIRPHYDFDKQIAKEQALRRKAQQIMTSIRDEYGARTVFNCKVDGVSKYVNIDTSKDVTSLRSIDRQLTEKLEGLKISSAKASRRRAEVEGQLSLDLTAM